MLSVKNLTQAPRAFINPFTTVHKYCYYEGSAWGSVKSFVTAHKVEVEPLITVQKGALMSG